MNKSLIYVVYAPYENQGKIFDYILEKFENVYLFSLGHHGLGKGKRTNKLIIYKGRKVVEEIDLFRIPVLDTLVFLVLPLRSFLNLIQILYLILKIYRRKGKTSIYFSSNGYAAWMGLVFKKMGLVKKTSYWICDYYPINHENKVIQAMRWFYWKFEMLAVKSDILSLHNLRLVKVWKENGAILKKFQIIPIGTEKARFIRRTDFKYTKLVFLGVVKKSQGLDYIFDAAGELQKFFPKIELRVLGPGPDIDYFRKRAQETGLKTRFYGYVNEQKIDDLILESTIGIAPYMPDPSNVSFYGDPGKIKRYISLGLPVIATGIHEFSTQLEKAQAGVLVQYGNVKDLINAIKRINANFNLMSKNARALSNRYYYKDLYPQMFI